MVGLSQCHFKSVLKCWQNGGDGVSVFYDRHLGLRPCAFEFWRGNASMVRYHVINPMISVHRLRSQERWKQREMNSKSLGC
jgi:hypothetical protein